MAGSLRQPPFVNLEFFWRTWTPLPSMARDPNSTPDRQGRDVDKERQSEVELLDCRSATRESLLIEAEATMHR